MTIKVDNNLEQINCYEVTQYYLKDENGYIFENRYQSTKLYRHVYYQKQVYNGIVTWTHPEEDHVKGREILPAYWKWREKLSLNPYPVRYPNGFHHRHECVCALKENEVDANGEVIYQRLEYIESRKKIYCEEYARNVMQTDAFKKLQRLIKRGQSLQLVDVDVPNLPQGIDVSEDSYKKYLHDTSLAFGHAWTLGCCLLNKTWWK
jgi:hypothetical protein